METDAVSGADADAGMETDADTGSDIDDGADGETDVESGVEVDADHEEEAGETTDADAPVETETETAKTGADASGDTSYQYDVYESKYGYDYEDAYAAHGQGECEYYQGHSEAYPEHRPRRRGHVLHAVRRSVQWPVRHGCGPREAVRVSVRLLLRGREVWVRPTRLRAIGCPVRQCVLLSAQHLRRQERVFLSARDASDSESSYQAETYGSDSAFLSARDVRQRQSSSYKPRPTTARTRIPITPNYAARTRTLISPKLRRRQRDSYQSDTYAGENAAVRGPSLSDWLPTELLTVADQDFLRSLELLAEEPQDVRRAELANYLGSIGANSFEFTVRFEETTGVDVLSFVEDLPATAAMLATFRLIEQGAVSTEQGVELLRQALEGLPAEWIEDVREITRDAYASHPDVVQTSHGERSQQSLADSAVLTAVTACVRSSVDSWKGLWYCMADRLTPPDWGTSSLKFVALIGQVGVGDAAAR